MSGGTLFTGGHYSLRQRLKPSRCDDCTNFNSMLAKAEGVEVKNVVLQSVQSSYKLLLATKPIVPIHHDIIIIIIILMTREAGVAYKSIKYELCILKAEYTNLANEFTTTVFFDVNK